MMISAMGVPGCGKTTTFTNLANMYGLPIFTEPEEEYWPEGVLNYKSYPSGSFTMLSWFRSQRVPQWYKAHAIRDASAVLIDSCYDILLNLYIDCPSMSWLINKEDPYYFHLKTLSYADNNQMPRPDCIVFFHIDYQPWLRNLSNRGRDSDKCIFMKHSFYAMQHDMYEATKEYCEDRSVKLVDFSPYCYGGGPCRLKEGEAPREGLSRVLEEKGVQITLTN